MTQSLRKIFLSTKQTIAKNYLALLIAVIVGLIYMAPNVFFILNMGDRYQGIPMMQTANEDFYTARVQEIVDGHPLIGSHTFLEYKNQWPLSPPLGELFYAAPALILNTSPLNIIIASRFFLPAILFLLIYFLIRAMTFPTASASGKINAIAGSLLIVLGYDLIDYHSLWRFFTGQDILTGGFLIWSRPVNPILGAVFLFAFLNFIWRIVQKTKNGKTAIGGAALFLALMIMSYFFSWGVALSIWGVLALIYLSKKEYGVIKNLFWVLFWAIFIALPYWYLLWQAAKSPWYKDSVFQDGLFLTHYPLLNKLMLVTLGLYFISAILLPILNKVHDLKGFSFKLLKNIFKDFQNWHWFSLSFILGSLWAYSQQIITGRTIWPYHFVQYTIPLAMVVGLVLLCNSIRPNIRRLWIAGVVITIFSSTLFGLYTQVSVYKKMYPYYVGLQSYAPLFSWLNQQKKDCVVLVTDKANTREISGLIPSFTHCDVYTSSWIFSLMPSERIYHNYLVDLKLKGLTSRNIDEYVRTDIVKIRPFLSSNWQGRYGVTDFPDFSDEKLEERVKKLPEDFKKFAKEDFKRELKKYHLDYILSEGPLPDDILNELPGTEITFKSDNVFVYNFKND